jgi:chemotaxis protein MotC
VWSDQALSKQPFLAVRELHEFDDRMAQGDLAAYVQRTTAWNETREVFEKAAQDVWKDPRNVRAAIVWTLAGGDPGTLERLSAQNLVSASDLAPATLAVALAKGELTAAHKLMTDIDPLKAHPAVCAAVSLAISDRLGPDLEEKAIALLTATIVRSPQTFFAEASYRRLIIHYIRKKSDKRARDALAKYFTLFPKSIFVDHVIEELIAATGESDSARDDQLVSLLASAIPQKSLGPTASGLLGAAREALRTGRLKVAALLSEAAIVRRPNQDGMARARLYIGAARAPLGAGASDIGGTDGGSLSGMEKSLLHGVQAIAKRAGRLETKRSKSELPAITDKVIAQGRAAVTEANKERPN